VSVQPNIAERKLESLLLWLGTLVKNKNPK